MRLLMRAAARLMRPWRAATCTLFDAFPVQPGDVVMLGDSITAAGPWAEMFRGAPVRNLGVASDTTADVLARLQQVTTGQPTAVFIMLGINDLRTGVPVAKLLDNYATIVDQLASGEPGARVFVQSILPTRRRFASRIVAVNRELQAMATAKGHEFIDLYPLFATEQGAMRRDLSHDGVHLLGPGYAVWRSGVADLMAVTR